MTVFYTGKGDDGTTGLLGSSRVRKDDPIIEAIGGIDELNSSIGLAIANVTDDRIANMLQAVQNNLFIMGAELAAAANDKDILRSKITKEKVDELERAIGELNAELPELKKFVLPGGSVGGASLHLARAICRRAERAVVSCPNYRISSDLVRYLNRLSSFLFAAALKLNRKEGIEEANPTY